MPCNKALSFCRSKIILDRPNYFGRVQIILDVSKLDFSGLIFIILTRPKQIGHLNNYFVPVQNDFRPIKGQGISSLKKKMGKITLSFFCNFLCLLLKKICKAGGILHLHYLRKLSTWTMSGRMGFF